MPQFTYEEFENQTILTVELKTGEQLDNMAMGMLSNNKLNGILPFTFSQMEEKRFLKFNVTGLQKLPHYFAGFVTKQKFITVLEGMARCVEELQDYMLDETILLLETEYLWVDEVNQKIYVLPLPLQAMEKQYSFFGFLKSLMFSIQFNQNENCDYVAKFMSFLNGNTFSLEEFLNLMEELKVTAAKATVTQTPPQPVAAIPINPIAPKISEPIKVFVPEEKKKEKKKGLFGLFGENKNEKPQKIDTKVEVKAESTKKQKENLKVKQNEKQKENKKKSKKESQNTTQKEINFAIPNAKKESIQTPVSESMQSSFAETTVLSALEEGTTVLTANTAATPYLVRKKSNQKIKIEKAQITIGKDASSDFCITDNTAISRHHAELLIRNGMFYIKDNHSTNHTYVNSVTLTPGQEIALDGSESIQLADEEFAILFY